MFRRGYGERNRFFPHAHTIDFPNPFGKGNPFALFQIFRNPLRNQNKNAEDGHRAEVCFEQRIDDERHQLSPEGNEFRAADTADQKGEFPAKLHQNSDNKQPKERESLLFVLLHNIVYDRRAIPRNENERHISVIRARRALNFYGRQPRAKRRRHHRRRDPPYHDEERPLEQMLILGNPKPNPGKICNAVAHAHPEKHPEQISAFDGARAEQKMKNAVIDNHIQHAARQSKQHGKIFFAKDQKSAKKEQKHRIEINIERIKHPLRDDFRLRRRQIQQHKLILSFFRFRRRYGSFTSFCNST